MTAIAAEGLLCSASIRLCQGFAINPECESAKCLQARHFVRKLRSLAARSVYVSIRSGEYEWHLGCDFAGDGRTGRKAEIREPLATVKCTTAVNDVGAMDILLMLRLGCLGWLRGQTGATQSLSSSKMQCFSYLFQSVIQFN